MLPNGAVLVQQQTSSGVQLILKSPPPQTQPKPGIVLANGSIQPQAVIVQGRTQAHQVNYSIMFGFQISSCASRRDHQFFFYLFICYLQI